MGLVLLKEEEKTPELRFSLPCEDIARRQWPISQEELNVLTS